MKRESSECLGELHRRLGPGLKAVTLSLVKEESVKGSLSKILDEHPYDPSLLECKTNKRSLCVSTVPESATGLEVPKTNLFESLPDRIVDKLVSEPTTIRSFSYPDVNRDQKKGKLPGNSERKQWKKLRAP